MVMTMPDDRATKPSAEATALVERLAHMKVGGIFDGTWAKEIDAFTVQAMQRALAEIRQIIGDVSGEGDASDPNELNWINACTAIDNRVRELIAASPPAPPSDIEHAVRRAVEQERERIYKAAEIRWQRGFLEEVRAVLIPEE